MHFFENIKWSPAEYKEASVIARETGEELLSRLTWMTLKPKVVLDMGCGNGALSAHLKAYYGDATLFAVDHSLAMLNAAKEVLAPDQTSALICADALHLPFHNQSVDLIFANLLLPWHVSVKDLLCEWQRVLRPQGLLIFTALGIDTLKEWKHLFDANEMPNLMDMHDLGDLLMEEKFEGPVLDVDYYTLTYRDKKHLLHELIKTGMWFPKEDEVNKAAILNQLGEDPEKWELTFEVIYGHAFMPERSETDQTKSNGTISISLESLKQQLKKNTRGC
jgi:malonyl-CoA O-methyltransferase